MSRKPTPTLFDLLDSIGCRFEKDSFRVPDGWGKLFAALEPFREDIKAEGLRRLKLRKRVKPISSTVPSEELKHPSIRLLWELQAHVNAHAVIQEVSKESPCTGEKWLRGAKHGFLCGFMLAVELMAESYGVDLDTVPDLN